MDLHEDELDKERVRLLKQMKLLVRLEQFATEHFIGYSQEMILDVLQMLVLAILAQNSASKDSSWNNKDEFCHNKDVFFKTFNNKVDIILEKEFNHQNKEK